jgi:membrane protein
MARGRTAETPGEIPAKGWKDIAFRVKDEIAADHVGLVAAGVAFYGLLALFPAITACMAIAGLLTEPQGIVDQLAQIGQLLPAQAADIIIGQASAVAGSDEGGLGIAAVFGILLAIYSASKGMASLMEGMNVAYDEGEDRGFIKLTLLKLGLTLFLIIGFLLGVGVAMVLPAIFGNFGLGPVVEWTARAISWAVLVLLTVFGLAVLYRYGPSRDRPEWKWVTPGAMLATLLWVVGSVGFAFYVGNFANYNETFGTLGGVIVLLMWLWLSAYIVLLGAEIDSEMEAQTRRDTTVGPDEPMGQRGAAKADKLGETKA